MIVPLNSLENTEFRIWLLYEKKKSHTRLNYSQITQGKWVWKLDLRWESGLGFGKASASRKYCLEIKLMNSEYPWWVLFGDAATEGIIASGYLLSSY